MARIDLLFIIIFALAGIAGFRKGFIAQAVMLVALLLGLWAAIHLADVVTYQVLHQQPMEHSTARLVALTVIFASVVLLVYFAGKFARRILQLTLLGWLDRLLGLLLSIFKTALLLSVLLTILGSSHLAERLVDPTIQQRSLFYGPVQRLAPAIYPRLRSYGQMYMDDLQREHQNWEDD